MCDNGLAHIVVGFREKLKMKDIKEKIISEIKKIFDPEIQSTSMN